MMVAAEEEVSAAAAVLNHPLNEQCAVFRSRGLVEAFNRLDARNGLGHRFDEIEHFGAGGQRCGFAGLDDFSFDFISALDAFDDVLDVLHHVLVNLTRFAAHFELHIGMNGRDIAAFAGIEPAYCNAGRAFAAARNALHHHGGRAGGHQCAAALFRVAPRMRRTAVEVNVKFGGGEKPAFTKSDRAELGESADMSADQGVDIIDHARGSHGACAADTFFGRLEEHLDGAFELILVINEPAADFKCNRSVSVVAAGMHKARALGAETAGDREMIG